MIERKSMKQLLFLFLGLVLGVSQAIRSGGEELPSGSYQHTCINCFVHNNILFCQCSYPDQAEYNDTLLNLASGTGEIVNCFGILKYGQCGGDQLPAGRYKQTCKDCVIGTLPHSKQQALWCSCPLPGTLLRRAKYIKSGLLLNDKTTTAINVCSGSLVYGTCDKVMPSGSYQRSCTQCYIKGALDLTIQEPSWIWKQIYSLHCNCKNIAGNVTPTSVDITLKSNEQVHNCNGQLKVDNC